ncbi:hypothetical protein AVEN_57289-1 [Araneus ventricosus]|uniref:Uncharacterized protein n=1 Tax=Araneus ventricosus TaxID=182803 RepID=A0A4Y2IRH2_ARAVE|nr:hypothetical protein AVEN_57289-1 [Araneus ventricosus]
MSEKESQSGLTVEKYTLDSRSVPVDTGQNGVQKSTDPFAGESPEIQGLLEKAIELEMEIQAAIASSKATAPKQTEIREPLKEIMENAVQQQVMIGHLMGRLTSDTKERSPSYAQMVSSSCSPG